MKFLLPSIIAGAGVIAGAFGGNMLKPTAEAGSPVMAGGDEDASGSGQNDDGQAAEGDTYGKKDKKAKKDSRSSKSGASKDVSYYKFSREFVIPIMRDGQVTALVILHIQLEVDSSIESSLFSMEPKLRDNIMTTLVEISHDGHLFDNLTEPESYESIRALVLEGLKTVKSEGIENILILDMARQDL